ncbi:berberine bridge enzyme-like 8 [Papaver somniferum]|uniref:berberine bridge enzyme-like 8 n=1 Tax=Papaver somniferum TaxID=3469 RepID=UPI000E6F493C|nr:berberine bridge enzyme-like 8 [Papaver somniferum]
MGISRSSILVSFLFSFLAGFLVSIGTSSSIHKDFFYCLSHHSKTNAIPIYTPKSSNYTSILQSNIANFRFNSSSTRKPDLIITPLQESHVQAAVICSRKYGLQIKVRSGGHDFEGLSYISDVPFIIVDMFNLRSIKVGVRHKQAWVQSGATLGEVYYRIAEKSQTLAFPAGPAATVGVGGHLSGGGYGYMLRKYGMAADNVINARIVDANGRLLNKKTMGKDLFWAIRGGGGGNFGIVIAWKIRLVSVPRNVTVFSVNRSLAQGATNIVHRWQEVAHQLPPELVILVILTAVNSAPKGEKTIVGTFSSLFLGDAKKLQKLMKQRFPELGLGSKDCTEMSWIQSVLFLDGMFLNGTASSVDILLKRTKPKLLFKVKSDYVKKPIPQIGLEGLWERLLKEDQTISVLVPYGGRMSEISESKIPYAHRGGNIFKIVYMGYWIREEEPSEKYIDRVRRLYEYMTPYVSKSPREAYINYRDLDLGQNKNGTTTYLEAKVWGEKYYKGNFNRLLNVKTKVDPNNFFRHEQSVPSIAY